jgi:hypothetical protein
MSSAEFAEWMAYYNHDPFGGFRNDLQAAIIARTVAAAFVGQEAPDTAAFIPKFWTSREDDEEEEQPDSASTDVLEAKITSTMSALSILRPRGKAKSVLELKPPTKEA